MASLDGTDPADNIVLVYWGKYLTLAITEKSQIKRGIHISLRRSTL